MERDIDRIIADVRKQLPEVQVHQLKVVHPGDDDGVWWFSVPGVKSDVQIDSTNGQCPFLVDDSDTAAAAIDSVQEVVRRIIDFFSKNVPHR